MGSGRSDSLPISPERGDPIGLCQRRTVDTISIGPRAYVTRAEGLPNGRLLLSMMTGGENQIAVREPDGTLRKLLMGWDARLTPTGHLLFSRQEGATWSIAAAPFDATTAGVTGEVTVLSRDVPVRYATPAAATAAGDVFYIAGSPRSDRRAVLWTARGRNVNPGATRRLALADRVARRSSPGARSLGRRREPSGR